MIESVGIEIRDVKDMIVEVEKLLETESNEESTVFLRRKELSLRDKEQSLRDKEQSLRVDLQLLREKELILLRRSMPPSTPIVSGVKKR